jgi:hypothetical protein
VSILLGDINAEYSYTNGKYLGQNFEPLLCGLEDGVAFTTDLSMLMFHGDPRLRRDSEIIDRVVDAALYIYWTSLLINGFKLHSRKIALVHPIGGYYSFNMYHMQPAFYLLLMGWCLSALCFIVELLCNRVLSKKV